MGRETFEKHERLLKWCDFQNVLKSGRNKKIDSICTVFWIANGVGHRRLGIIASKKVGKAVVRNRTKRLIRSIFRINKEKIRPASDIVVVSGKGLDRIPFQVLESKIMSILYA